MRSMLRAVSNVEREPALSERRMTRGNSDQIRRLLMLDRFSSPVQVLAAFFGAAFIGAAVVGFVPGLTTDFGDLSFAGNDSHSEVLGILQVSVLHNLVHLLFGAVGIVLAMAWRGARAFLIGGGLVYGILGLYGFAVDKAGDANFVPTNSADDWLHIAFAVTMISGGLLLARRERRELQTA